MDGAVDFADEEVEVGDLVAFATFLLNGPQHLFLIKLYRKIAEAPVQFQPPSEPRSGGAERGR